MNSKESCETCKFSFEKHSNILECRRNPPVNTVPDTSAGGLHKGVWVNIEKDDWCGEYICKTEIKE